MTKEELALALNGCQVGEEINDETHELAKKNGLVVVYGASDDLIEFAGAFHDEVYAWNGAKIRVNKEGVMVSKCEPDCPYFIEELKKGKSIQAIWGSNGVSWRYETEIEHAEFEVLEDDEVYCRGIVFHVDDIFKTVKINIVGSVVKEN